MKKKSDPIERKLKKLKGENTLDISRQEWTNSQINSLTNSIINFPQIISLKMDSTGLTDDSLKMITEIKQLKNLDVSHNSLTIKCGKYFQNIENLNLSGNKDLKENFFNDFSSPNLQRLDLSHTDIQNLSGLKNKMTLNYLDVRHTRVNNKGIQGLKNHPGLNVLHLSNTQVTTAGILDFMANNNSLITKLMIAGMYLDKEEKLRAKISHFIKNNIKRLLVTLFETFISLSDPMLVDNQIMKHIGEYLIDYSESETGISLSTLTDTYCEFFQLISLYKILIPLYNLTLDINIMSIIGEYVKDYPKKETEVCFSALTQTYCAFFQKNSFSKGEQEFPLIRNLIS